MSFLYGQLMLIEEIQHDAMAAAARAGKGCHFEASAVMELKRSHVCRESFALYDSIDRPTHAAESIVIPATSNTVACESVRRSKNPICCLNRITAIAALSALSSEI